MLSRTTKASIVRVLRGYAESASVHGVGYVVSARSSGDRLLWLCLVLLNLSLSILGLSWKYCYSEIYCSFIDVETVKSHFVVELQVRKADNT